MARWWSDIGGTGGTPAGHRRDTGHGRDTDRLVGHLHATGRTPPATDLLQKLLPSFLDCLGGNSLFLTSLTILIELLAKLLNMPIKSTTSSSTSSIVTVDSCITLLTFSFPRAWLTILTLGWLDELDACGACGRTLDLGANTSDHYFCEKLIKEDGGFGENAEEEKDADAEKEEPKAEKEKGKFARQVGEKGYGGKGKSKWKR